MTGRPRAPGRGAKASPAARSERAAEKERHKMDLACERARQLFAENYREARTAAGVTQREVHERTGIDISSLSKIENGQGNPSINTLAKMAHAIGCTVSDLFAPRT